MGRRREEDALEWVLAHGDYRSQLTVPKLYIVTAKDQGSRQLHAYQAMPRETPATNCKMELAC